MIRLGGFLNLARGLAADSPKPAARTTYYNNPPSDGEGWYWTPRVRGPHDYPLDLDGSERIVRPKRGLDFWGTQMLSVRWNGDVVIQKWMVPTMPQNNLQVISQMMGKNPFGPLIPALNTYAQSFGVASFPGSGRKIG